MSLLCCAITKPGIATVSKHAFNSAPVEHNHGWDGKIHLPQSAERVKLLLGLLDDSIGVVTGGQLIRQMDPQELDTVYLLYLKVLLVLRERLVLYADSLLLVMRPTTVVSSGNFMI